MSSSPTITKRRKIEPVGELKQRRSSLIPKSTNSVNEDGISNCFHKVKTSLYVSLAPLYIQDPIQGIKSQHLDPLIMTYFPQSKGIVLGYFNISLTSENHSTDSEGNPITVAKITNDTPFAFLWVNVEFLVWRPQVGDIVEGWIYMQTQSHIGLLIHDTFNATIKKFNIPSNWEFVPNQVDEIDAIPEDDENSGKVRSLGVWRDENQAVVDGKIRFTIKAVHTAGRVVSVEGTLVKPGSESDSLPVTVSKLQHKKFGDDDGVVVSATLLADKVEDENDKEMEIPLYAPNSDDEVVAEENSSDDDVESD